MEACRARFVGRMGSVLTFPIPFPFPGKMRMKVEGDTYTVHGSSDSGSGRIENSTRRVGRFRRAMGRVLGAGDDGAEVDEDEDCLSPLGCLACAAAAAGVGVLG